MNRRLTYQKPRPPSVLSVPLCFKKRHGAAQKNWKHRATKSTETYLHPKRTQADSHTHESSVDIPKTSPPLCALRAFVFQKTPRSRAEELETQSRREHGDLPALKEHPIRFPDSIIAHLAPDNSARWQLARNTFTQRFAWYFQIGPPGFEPRTKGL